MKKPIIIVLLCLSCGLFSCTRTNSGTTIIDLLASNIELTPNDNEIVNEIHKNGGWHSSSQKLNEYIERINVDNVGGIIVIYERTYGRSIFNEIMSNVFISSKTRANAVKHIKDMFIQRAKRYGVYTNGIDKLIDEHIDYEKNKFGRMTSKDIDQNILTLLYRCIQTTSYTNTLYPVNGKTDEGVHQGHVIDCWLIEIIKTLSINPEGQEMLDDMISIVNEIHSNGGWPSSSKKLNEYIEKINVDNVIGVLIIYKRTYGKSIFNEIMSNAFISSKTRANAVKHIKDIFIQRTKRYGVYTDDIDKLINGHIDYEKNKLGRMKSKDIDQDIFTFLYRCNQTTSYITTLYPANGKIDDKYYQGQVWDCWLIAAIKSLSINPKGQEMLNDLISIDDKGNVTVQLKGVDRKYTISKDELEGANEFAQGDLDVRAIEIAVNKYLHEIEDHTTVLKKIKDIYVRGTIALIFHDINDGMIDLSSPYYLLFGKEYCSNVIPDKGTIEKIQSGIYSTLVASQNNSIMDGYKKHHAYAAIRADDNYVYLSDPHNPDTSLSMTHVDFINFFNQSYSMQY